MSPEDPRSDLRQPGIGARVCLAAMSAVLIWSCDTPVTPAPGGIVEGTVLIEGRPVGGLEVSLDSRRTATDSIGGFRFAQVSEGTHQLAMADVGDPVIDTPTRSIAIRADGEVVRVSFTGHWTRSAALHISIWPRQTYAVSVEGPDTIAVVTDRTTTYWEPTGNAFIDSLRSGTYSVRLQLPDTSTAIPLVDSVSVSLGPSDTSSVELVVGGKADVIVLNDTVRGPRTALDWGGRPETFRLWLEAGESVELEFQNGPKDVNFTYTYDYYASVYSPAGDELERRVLSGTGKSWREGDHPWKVDNIVEWPGVSLPEAGWVTILVSVVGSARGLWSTGYWLVAHPVGS